MWPLTSQRVERMRIFSHQPSGTPTDPDCYYTGRAWFWLCRNHPNVALFIFGFLKGGPSISPWAIARTIMSP
jgi:hypothetical protein